MKLLRPKSLVLFATLLLLAGCGEADPPPATATVVPATLPPMDTVVVDPTPTAGAAIAPAAQAIVSVVLSSESVAVGETVDAVVSVEGVEDLFGLEVHLAYDADRLAVVDADVEQTGIQVAHGDLLEVEYILLNQATPATGLIDYAVAQRAGAGGTSGDGALARISLEATASGSAELRFIAVILANSQGQPVPVTFSQEAVSVEVK